MDPRYKQNIRSKHPGAKKTPKAYRREQAESAGRLGRLLMTYDAALAAAKAHDKEKLFQALALLKRSMKLEPAPEFVIGLMRLYTHCEHAAKAGNFEEVIRILSQLKLAFSTLNK